MADEAPNTPPAGETPPAGSAPVPTPPPAATPPAAPASKEPTIAELQAENKRLAKEAEDARVRAKGAVADGAKRDQLIALAAAIGIELPSTGAEVTVDSLQQQLTEAMTGKQTTESENQKLQADKAIARAAWTNQVDPGKSTYLEFLLHSNPAFAALDQASADYQASVTELVKTITASDPIFAVSPGGAARSGGENFGGAGAPGEVTKAAFDQMNVMDKTKLFQTNPELFRRLQATGS